MPLLQGLPPDKRTPSRLWSQLDPGTRRLAAQSLYDSKCDDDDGRTQADRAIASALRYREASVRRLSHDKRADYVARAAHPDDSLATSLLLALHLLHRRPMLSAFLDELDIPHANGVIESGHVVDVSDAERLSSAVAKLRAGYPTGEVDLYLASLVTMDPKTWGRLIGTLAQQAD